MKYKVHHLEVEGGNHQVILDHFLNKIVGEVISIVPHVTRFFLFYGCKIDYYLIIEKIKIG